MIVDVDRPRARPACCLNGAVIVVLSGWPDSVRDHVGLRTIRPELLRRVAVVAAAADDQHLAAFDLRQRRRAPPVPALVGGRTGRRLAAACNRERHGRRLGTTSRRRETEHKRMGLNSSMEYRRATAVSKGGQTIYTMSTARLSPLGLPAACPAARQGVSKILRLLRRYIFSTDHKVIGLLYGFTSLFFLLVGFALVVIMRWQLAYPGSRSRSSAAARRGERARRHHPRSSTTSSARCTAPSWCSSASCRWPSARSATMSCRCRSARPTWRFRA